MTWSDDDDEPVGAHGAPTEEGVGFVADGDDGQEEKEGGSSGAALRWTDHPTSFVDGRKVRLAVSQEAELIANREAIGHLVGEPYLNMETGELVVDVRLLDDGGVEVGLLEVEVYRYLLNHIGVPNGRLCAGLLVLVRGQLDSSRHSREQQQQTQRHRRWAPQLPSLSWFSLFPSTAGPYLLTVSSSRDFPGVRACACFCFHISVLRRTNTALHCCRYAPLLRDGSGVRRKRPPPLWALAKALGFGGLAGPWALSHCLHPHRKRAKISPSRFF